MTNEPTESGVSGQLPEHLIAQLRHIQRVEVTEHEVYRNIAARLPAGPNRDVLERIAADELRHAEFWAAYTGERPGPRRMLALFYSLLARLLGLSFALKLMERAEQRAEQAYEGLAEHIPEAAQIAKEEDEHERQLLNVLDEEVLRYAGSVVLGLNDALVELTGALAGLTFALQNTRLVALAGLVTGLAAAMSMSASEYLSTKAEVESGKVPTRAAIYTGLAYLGTVALLIFPYFVFSNYLLAFGCTALNAVLIIWFFTFYISVARDLPFRRRFVEMISLSLGIASVSFLIGVAVRKMLGVEV